MAIDLRKKWYRNKKDYWRAVREGRLPWPKYKKPVLTAIKLDPRQAIIAACETGGAWFNTTGTGCWPQGGARYCLRIRGIGANTGFGPAANASAQPS